MSPTAEFRENNEEPTRILDPGRNAVRLGDCSVSFSLDGSGRATLKYGDIRAGGRDYEVYIGSRLWVSGGELIYMSTRPQKINFQKGDGIAILQVRARGYGEPRNHPSDPNKFVVDSTVVKWVDEGVSIQ